MSSGTEAHLFVALFHPSQTGQGPLQLQPSIRAQEDVEEGIQQGIEAGQTIAKAINEKNGTLQSTRLIGQQQGHKPVSTHEVVGPKDNNEIDSDDDQDAHNFVALVVREGRRSLESHANVG